LVSQLLFLIYRNIRWILPNYLKPKGNSSNKSVDIKFSAHDAFLGSIVTNLFLFLERKHKIMAQCTCLLEMPTDIQCQSTEEKP
jgi:hypothetical protein